MTDARDLRCRAQTLDTLGDRSIPSDHIAIRTSIQKLASVFCSKQCQLHDARTDLHGAKLLVTATAMRAYRNRHLNTLIRCVAQHGNTWDTVSLLLLSSARMNHAQDHFHIGQLSLQHENVTTTTLCSGERGSDLKVAFAGTWEWAECAPAVSWQIAHRLQGSPRTRPMADATGTQRAGIRILTAPSQ